MKFKTADIADEYDLTAQYVEPIFNSYGKYPAACGSIVTIKCFEDNSLVRTMVDQDGSGKFLVVDAGGSKRCAMLGDLLTEKAVNNNWAGILIYGLIRDSKMISQMDIGVWALGTLPLKSVKLGAGQQQIPLHFAGVKFTVGHHIYADEDGIILLEQAYANN